MTMKANMLRGMSFLSLLFLFEIARAAGTWTATPFNPAAVPLAVRTPYLSCWLPQGAGTALNAAWPTFWTGSTLGWAGYVRVDGVVYNFMGDPAVAGASKAVQKSLEFTSTQSIFVMTAGPVDLTVTFLSPVEPTDLVKQSLPFSYLSLSAAPTDGGTHCVQIYTDISAEWISGDDSLTANWSTTVGDIITHQVQLENQELFTEVSDHIQQGSAFYSVTNTNTTTFQTGQDTLVRAQFIANGVLPNTQDTSFRAVSDDWPVFAFAQNLGCIGSTASDPVVFSIGHVRDPAIKYLVAGGATQNRSVYFWSAFSTVDDVISSFLSSFPTALSTAQSFDAKVSSDASAISSDYASIVALSIRQGLGAIEITLSKNADGSFNTEDVMVFMKEISSDGNVNTVDVIFPTWPLFLYTNPLLGRYLLEPLFQYQATGQYPNVWAVHDMGTSYPKALGHNDGKDEMMPLEESGNMLIMTLSYTQSTNDLSLITKYSPLLTQWSTYLTTSTLIPANQISTDDFAGALPNQTNLAIKGVIGINAMSVVAGLLGDEDGKANYSSIVASYVPQILAFATSSDGQHLTLSYGDDTSWGLSYNLLADKLLNLTTFPQSVFDMHSAWYPGVANELGVPLDTRHTYTKSDWSLWTAALSSTSSTRDLLISAVHAYASDGKNDVPLSDWYDTISGEVQGFAARPVVGGHLALLVV